MKFVKGVVFHSIMGFSVVRHRHCYNVIKVSSLLKVIAVTLYPFINAHVLIIRPMHGYYIGGVI